MKEGSSLILTLFKNISNDENRLTRINVQKIASLKDLFNSPINEVSFELKSKEQIEKRQFDERRPEDRDPDFTTEI